MTHSWRPLIFGTAVGLLLAGCSTGGKPLWQPVHEMGPWMSDTVKSPELLVAKSDFSMEVVRLTDARRPRSLERGPREQAIDTYDPDTLLGGITTRIPALYEKYLAYKPKGPKHYKVEIDVRELRTEVLNGTFLSGPFGRYMVKLEVEAIARRPNSDVVLQKVYTFEDTMRRVTYDGRSPSAEMDEARLVDLVDAAVRTTAAAFANDLRGGDARRWNPETEAAPVPTTRVRMVRQPTLTRATGTAAGYGSELVIPATNTPVPTPQYAPDSTPTPVVPAPRQITW